MRPMHPFFGRCFILHKKLSSDLKKSVPQMQVALIHNVGHALLLVRAEMVHQKKDNLL